MTLVHPCLRLVVSRLARAFVSETCTASWYPFGVAYVDAL